jgi:hypothetical protein
MNRSMLVNFTFFLQRKPEGVEEAGAGEWMTNCWTPSVQLKSQNSCLWMIISLVQDTADELAARHVSAPLP